MDILVLGGFFSSFGQQGTTLLWLKTLSEPFRWCSPSTSSAVTVRACCWSVPAALVLKVPLIPGRFGAPGWLTLMDACPWNSRYSETTRRGYKCCLSGFRHDRDAWAGENVSGSPYPAGKGQTSPPRWTPCPVAELPGLSPASVTPTRAAIAVIRAAGDVISWEHPFHWGKGGGERGPCDSCRSDQEMLLSSGAKPGELLPCVYGIFYLRFSVFDSPAVRCLLLFPRENSQLCESSSRVLLKCKPMRSLICALEGGLATHWTACEWSC